MKRTIPSRTSFAVWLAGTLLVPASAHAAVINLPNYSLTPDGQNLTTTFQNTNVNVLNGNTSVLPASGTPVVYFVTSFTFGLGSDAHMQAQFYVNQTSAPRLGIEVQDTGLVSIIGTGTPLPTVNLAQDMAGQTITLLAKLQFDANNSVTYSQSNPSNDTVMNVWVNPTLSDVEGSGLSAGDMSTIWNSAGFNWFRQTIQNQLTPGTAGDSTISNTTILTGSDATFANALAIAVPEPSAALLGGLGALAFLRRRRSA
jgi:hypothetical protein